jgi:hypothetical protein
MHDILIRARELIADPAHWTQHYYTGDGPIDAPETKCFCLVGAVDRAVIEKRGWLDRFSDDNFAIAAVEDSSEGAAAIKHLQAQLTDFVLVSDFNDSHTHAEVLQLLDRAIEKAPA